MKRLGGEWAKVGKGRYNAQINTLWLSIMPDPGCGYIMVCSTAGHVAELRPHEGKRATLNQVMRAARDWAERQEVTG